MKPIYFGPFNGFLNNCILRSVSYGGPPCTSVPDLQRHSLDLGANEGMEVWRPNFEKGSAEGWVDVCHRENPWQWKTWTVFIDMNSLGFSGILEFSG